MAGAAIICALLLLAAGLIASRESSPAPRTDGTGIDARHADNDHAAATTHAHDHDGHTHADHNHPHESSTTNSGPESAAAHGNDHGHSHPVVPAATLQRIAADNPQLAASSSTSGEGLQAEPGPVSGTMIDLQGRFQSVAVATVGPDGKTTFTCVTDIGRDFAAATNNAASNTSR